MLCLSHLCFNSQCHLFQTELLCAFNFPTFSLCSFSFKDALVSPLLPTNCLLRILPTCATNRSKAAQNACHWTIHSFSNLMCRMHNCINFRTVSNFTGTFHLDLFNPVLSFLKLNLRLLARRGFNPMIKPATTWTVGIHFCSGVGARADWKVKSCLGTGHQSMMAS